MDRIIQNAKLYYPLMVVATLLWLGLILLFALMSLGSIFISDAGTPESISTTYVMMWSFGLLALSALIIPISSWIMHFRKKKEKAFKVMLGMFVALPVVGFILVLLATIVTGVAGAL